MAHESIPVAEKQTPDLNIPKSREIYSGDINDAVIKVQQITGFEITPDWWLSEVGNHGSTEEILDRFDQAFESFVQQSNHETSQPEVEFKVTRPVDVIQLAENELAAFDKEFKDSPEKHELRQDFLDALEAHLKEKYFSETNEEIQKMAFEQRKIDELNRKAPESERSLAFERCGVEVIACNRELSEQEAKVIKSALDKISEKIGGEKVKELFGGVKLYAGDELIEGGGLALPMFDAIIIDTDKIGITISQMEEMLDPIGQYKKGDQSKLVENPDQYEASELGIVHELGHILEHRLFGDVDKAFSELDQAEAPTEYGSKSPREDFAESFMYYIYNGKIEAQRLAKFEEILKI